MFRVSRIYLMREDMSRWYNNIIALLLVACLHPANVLSQARQDTVYLGYCNGVMSGTGISKVGIKGISAAVVFPAELLEDYAGAEVIGLRIGLAADVGFTEMEAWVRTSLSDADIVSAPVSSPVVGWNEIYFSAPVEIDGKSSLSFGYTFQQKKSVKCMAVGGERNDNGCWLANGSEWENASAEHEGALCIEAIVTGDNFKQYDLRLLSCEPDSCNVMEYGTVMKVRGSVRNAGIGSVDGYSIVYKVGDGASETVSYEASMEYRGTSDFMLEIPSDIVPKGTSIPVEVKLLGMDGTEDEDMSDNIATFTFTTFDEADTFVHYPLLEEFTTEQCINCPGGAQRIEAAMEREFDGGWFSDRVIQVCHHAGYNTDWLTIPESEEYMELYNSYYVDQISGELKLTTYAPACTFDRGQYFRDTDTVPVIDVNKISILEEQFGFAVQVVALAEVVPELTYDEHGRRLDIKVKCRKSDAFDAQCPESYLTVFVLEDSIMSRDQAGQPGMVHRHVIRDVLTDVWGDALAWNGGEAESSYTVTIAGDWNERNIEIVAFLAERIDNNPSDSRVYNAARALLRSHVGVRNTDVQKNVLSEKYYSLDGICIGNRHNGGLCIRVTEYDDGTVSVVKYHPSAD